MVLFILLLVFTGLYFLGASLVRKKLQRDEEYKNWLPPDRRQWRPGQYPPPDNNHRRHSGQRN